MSTVRLSADEARRHARVRRKTIFGTKEADIARHAAEEGSASPDFEKAFKQGRLRIVKPMDVAAIRAKTGLSQARFAEAVQISPHTLRNWEQGRRAPEGPARALLLAIDRAPGAVLKALRVA